MFDYQRVLGKLTMIGISWRIWGCNGEYGGFLVQNKNRIIGISWELLKQLTDIPNLRYLGYWLPQPVSHFRQREWGFKCQNIVS